MQNAESSTRHIALYCEYQLDCENGFYKLLRASFQALTCRKLRFWVVYFDDTGGSAGLGVNCPGHDCAFSFPRGR